MAWNILEQPVRSISGSRDQENKVTLSRERAFTLDTSDANDDENDARNVLASSRGVFEGAPWPSDFRFFCESVTVNQVGPISYEATASYKTIPHREDENPNADPVFEPTKIRYSTINASVPTDVDFNGAPLQNGAKDLFEGQTVDVGDLSITLQKKYDLFLPSQFYDYMNKVNDAEFLGFAAGILRVTGIDAAEVIEAERRYWEVTVTITARKPIATGVTDAQAWYLRIRSEGFNRTIGGGKQPCIDLNGQDVTRPWPIDMATGAQLAYDVTPTFHFFQMYDTVDFSEMNLGVT